MCEKQSVSVTLSWQSTHSLGSFLWVLLRRLFLSQRQIPILSYNCREDGSPLISIALDLADRSLFSLHTNTVTRTVIQNIPLSCRPGYYSILATSITVVETSSQPKHYHEGQLPYLSCHRNISCISITWPRRITKQLYAYKQLIIWQWH